MLMVPVFISALTARGPAPREGMVGTWAKAANQMVESKGDRAIVFTDRLKE